MMARPSPAKKMRLAASEYLDASVTYDEVSIGRGISEQPLARLPLNHLGCCQ